MLCSLARLWKKATRVIVTAASVLAKRVAGWLRHLCGAHRTRVTRDPGYAAATVVVLGGLFGWVPIKEVLAAVLAAALGVHLTGRHDSSREAHRWNEEWDLA